MDGIVRPDDRVGLVESQAHGNARLGKTSVEHNKMTERKKSYGMMEEGSCREGMVRGRWKARESGGRRRER